MKKNVGQTDRTIRIVVGIVLIGLKLAGVLAGTVGTVALVAGIIALATGFINFCPLYTLLKINTSKS
ncbi:MAG: DUF2892 domain-containing protein [Chloroflexi bacterium]|nr:DUF2892 domain-containing protein [Chloroflexota bacterium]